MAVPVLGWAAGGMLALWVGSMVDHRVWRPPYVSFSSSSSGRAKDLAAWRHEALAQFDEIGPLAAKMGVLHLDRVEVVKEEEALPRDEAGQVHGYTLTRFLRNPLGECFMFTSTPRGPSLKFVPPKVVRKVLDRRH